MMLTQDRRDLNAQISLEKSCYSFPMCQLEVDHLEVDQLEVDQLEVDQLEIDHVTTYSSDAGFEITLC